MKLFKLIFYIIAIVPLVVTCDNVQAIRDKYVETPSFYEESVKNILEKVNNDSGTDLQNTSRE